VLPLIPKGEIVGKLVIIDVNSRRIPEAPRSDQFILRSLESGAIMEYL
jgi:hypothetical protein